MKRNILLAFALPCVLFTLLAATSGNINWTQIRSGDRHGTATKGQASDGTGTSGNVPTYDSGGSLTDGGGAPSLKIANGTAALGTSAIASGACATVVTVSATGVATTDTIQADFNADPTSTTGYTPSASGMLTIIKYPTTNNVSFKVCNLTGSSITPGAVTLNWRVAR